MMSSSSFQKKDFKAHVLPESETKKIPESEMKVMMAQVGEEDSIWGTVPDKKYVTAKESVFISKAITFYQMLVGIGDSDVTHLVVGGFQFAKGSNGLIYRNTYLGDKPKGGGGGGGTGAAKYKEQFLQEAFVGTIDEINFKLETEKDKNWKFPYIIHQDRDTGGYLIIRTRS